MRTHNYQKYRRKHKHPRRAVPERQLLKPSELAAFMFKFFGSFALAVAIAMSLSALSRALGVVI